MAKIFAMNNVPHIVRDRLKAMPPPLDHPDADLLTAFAEQSLPPAERTVMLDHLAVCADCREIVALALPPMEVLEHTPATVRRNWFSWPTLRWGFVAAGVVVLASLGVLQLRRHDATDMVASRHADTAVEESPAASSAPVSPLPPPQERVEEERGKTADLPQAQAADSAIAISPGVAGPNRAAPAAKPSSTPFSPVTGGLLHHTPSVAPGYGPKMPATWQQNNSVVVNNGAPALSTNQQPSAVSSAPQAPASKSADRDNETVEANSQALSLDTQTANQQVRTVDQFAASRPEQVAKTRVDKAKAPVPVASPGEISGYVVDATGAAVTNARVTITSETGSRASAGTNSQGAWLIAGLPTGNYRAQAEAPGFKITARDFTYDANQPSLQTFRLDVGEVSETVAVSAQAGEVQTMAGGAIADRGQNPYNPVLSASVMASPTPRWTISTGGALQISIDQGKTWQNVDVNASPGLSGTLGAVRAKQKDAKKQLTEPVAFRAVTAAGAEVWAGGNRGALYHSIDGGKHWNRVVPVANGSPLTGDILTLEFATSQSGKLTTSTPEVWTTSDAGQSWQKQ